MAARHCEEIIKIQLVTRAALRQVLACHVQ